MSCDDGVSSAADTTSKDRCLKLFKTKHVMYQSRQPSGSDAGGSGETRATAARVTVSRRYTRRDTQVPIALSMVKPSVGEGVWQRFEIWYQSAGYRTSRSTGFQQSENFYESKNMTSTGKRQPTGWRKSCKLAPCGISIYLDYIKN